MPSSCQGQAPKQRHPTFDRGQVGFALQLLAPASAGAMLGTHSGQHGQDCLEAVVLQADRWLGRHSLVWCCKYSRVITLA